MSWPGRGARVVAIECKDLELARTITEISHRLHEFRGEVVDGKPDRLKKHPLRIDVLKSRSTEVKLFTRSESTVQIEAWLVFSDLVPVRFSEITTQHSVRVATFDDLPTL